MRTMGITLSVAGLVLVSACNRSADSRTDDALKNDLALAAQVQPYQAQQFVTPSEQQMADMVRRNSTMRLPAARSRCIALPRPSIALRRGARRHARAARVARRRARTTPLPARHRSPFATRGVTQR